MRKEATKKRWNRNEKMVIGVLAFLVIVTLLLITAFWFMKQNEGKVENAHTRTYKYHYMLIESEADSTFYKSLYEGTLTAGRKENIYVENLAASLKTSRSIAERMEIAIAADVDGIIVEADASQQLQDLIDKASEQNIPVVTVYEDAPESKRTCFVGMNGHQLGEIYGSQVLKLKQENMPLKVTLLIDANTDSGKEQQLYTSMKESVSREDGIELNVVKVDPDDPFNSEETVRNLVLSGNGRPDVLVCTNEVDTSCAYQAVVDYNAVGKINIIGNYSAPQTLSAIQKGVIAASITIEAEEMGRKAVKALVEYRKNKFINEYETVEPQVITRENIEKYIKEVDKNES